MQSKLPTILIKKPRRGKLTGQMLNTLFDAFWPVPVKTASPDAANHYKFYCYISNMRDCSPPCKQNRPLAIYLITPQAMRAPPPPKGAGWSE